MVWKLYLYELAIFSIQEYHGNNIIKVYNE